jgi:hypothetical protein
MTVYSPEKRARLERIASRRSSDEHLTRLLVIGAGSAASVSLGMRLVGWLIAVLFLLEFVAWVRHELAVGALLADDRRRAVLASLPDARAAARSEPKSPGRPTSRRAVAAR